MGKLPEVYDAIWGAGKAQGIADFGVYTLNSLRMEKAYKGLGAELTNEITPVEADIMRFVKLDKDFIGKAAVEVVLQAEPGIRLCYGEVDATDCDVVGGERYSTVNGSSVSRHPAVMATVLVKASFLLMSSRHLRLMTRRLRLSCLARNAKHRSWPSQPSTRRTRCCGREVSTKSCRVMVMSGEQFASPPCFLHELDPEFRDVETAEPPKAKEPERPRKAETEKP